MITVIHLVSNLGTGNGVMNVLMNYYRFIDRNKIQFHFLYFQKKKLTFENEITSLGGHCNFITKPSIKKSFQNELFDLFQLYKDKNVIFHNHVVFLTFLFKKALIKNGITNIILHSHNTKFSDKFFSSVRNKILRFTIFSNNYKFMTCSTEAGIFLFGKKKYKQGKIFLLKNAIDLQKFRFNKSIRDSLRSKLFLGNDTVIGHVGRFSKQKNHKFLIDLFNKLLIVIPNAKLILIGDGELFDITKKYVNKLGLQEKVLFLGRISNTFEYLNAFDIFVLPSKFEGFPVVGVEAQASGIPLIYSSTITSEIEICNAIGLKITNNKYKWIKEIKNQLSINVRRDCIKLMTEKGYNISPAVKQLEYYYEDLF